MNDSSQMISIARVSTTLPARYLEQLCKHFAHKMPVTRMQGSGSITFSSGVCRMTAEADTLILQVSADSAPGLASLEDVVARHLKRFAFREDMQIEWQPA